MATLGEQPIHFSGDRQIWDRKINRVELFGHAAVNQQGETLTADYIKLDLKGRVLDASGNCVYMAADSMIYGEEMHFNLDTRTGTVVNGRISNDKFTLRGERINKLGPGRFQTHWGDYSTCRDCAPTWGLLGEDMDMEVEGYAYISNMNTRVKDASILWLPYLVVPMKTRRQSGVLFPLFLFGGVHGNQFVLPFYWAINRSSDATLGIGQYSERGWRFQGEGRYNLGGRDNGKISAFYTKDKSFSDTSESNRNSRWAFDVTQSHELPFKILEKLRWTEVSDNLYPFLFNLDVPTASDAFLPSTLVFSRSTEDVSAYISIQKYRNLLNSSPGLYSQTVQFDNRTVQALPSIVATSNDRFLIGSHLMGGLTLGFTHFSRPGGAFDFDSTTTADGPGVPFGSTPPEGQQPRLGQDPIRKAARYSLTPSMYTTLRPFDIFTVIPSVQYRSYFYDFGGNMPNLARGYLLFQTDLSTQIERIFEFPTDKEIPKGKHVIRPILTYSVIPKFGQQQNESHPFVRQITNAQQSGVFGYNFDDNDIVPITSTQNSANYFIPLGHSLSYGFTTQWIRRRENLKRIAPSDYQNAIEFSAGQAINLLELGIPREEGKPPRLFTRYFSNLTLTYDKFLSTSNYFYYPEYAPETPRHTISTGLTFILERSMHQRILTFDRSVTLGYTFNKINGLTSNLTGLLNYSINDYLMPYGSISYGFIKPSSWYAASAGVSIQSPSQCWKATSEVYYRTATGVQWAFDLSLNLTGSGFGGVTEIANQAQAQTLQ